MGLPYGEDPSVTAVRDTGALCGATHPRGRHTRVLELVTKRWRVVQARRHAHGWRQRPGRTPRDDGTCAVRASSLHRRTRANLEARAMDDASFDTLTHALAHTPTRRHTLQRLSGLLLGGCSAAVLIRTPWPRRSTAITTRMAGVPDLRGQELRQ